MLFSYQNSLTSFNVTRSFTHCISRQIDTSIFLAVYVRSSYSHQPRTCVSVVEIKRVNGLKQYYLLIDLRCNAHDMLSLPCKGMHLFICLCALGSLNKFQVLHKRQVFVCVENENASVVICMLIKINLFFDIHFFVVLMPYINHMIDKINTRFVYKNPQFMEPDINPIAFKSLYYTIIVWNQKM